MLYDVHLIFSIYFLSNEKRCVHFFSILYLMYRFRVFHSFWILDLEETVKLILYGKEIALQYKPKKREKGYVKRIHVNWKIRKKVQQNNN